MIRANDQNVWSLNTVQLRGLKKRKRKLAAG
jgi:hypothetical protein